MKKICILLVLTALCFNKAFCNYDNVQIVDNGYEGIVIAINPNVPEDTKIVDSLKQIWSDASKSLYVATKEHAYFKDITILVPTSWTSGSYDKSGLYSYDKADVLVADEHPGHGNEPYTLQFGGCQAHGEYIHLTPDYVVNDDHVASWGPKGKVMVHEWAHLRWGVFDETGGDGYPEFYFDSVTKKIEANKCPAALKGDFVHIETDASGNLQTSPCELNPQTGFPYEEECQFVPNEDQYGVTVSMMAYHFLENVVHFCHDDQSDPANLHNYEAPNEHNRLCGQRSAWDVIASSEDFEGLKPDPSVTDLEPNFNVVQPYSYDKIVLVVDTSNSMKNDNLKGDASKMFNAIQAADAFFKNYAPNGSEVGLIEFNKKVKVDSELTKINSQDDRDKLSSSLPAPKNVVCCETYIDLGVDKAVEMLKASGNTEGAQIICLTDGKQTRSWPPQSSLDVIEAGIVFHSVFFGVEEGNDFMIKLTDDTQGIWTYANSLIELTEFFDKVSEDNSGSYTGKSFELKSEDFVVKKDQDYTGSVPVDSTVGSNTVFSFSYTNSDAPYVDLYDPDDNMFCSFVPHSPECDTALMAEVDPTYRSIKFKIPGVAKAGTWTYTASSSSKNTVTASVSSQVSDPNVEPISVKAGMSSSTMDTATPITLYAQVTQGFQPILNVDVVATVSFPDGSSECVHLYDRGAAPDTRKSDGVYSAYFFEYKATGRYSMKVRVTGVGNSTISKTLDSTAAYNFGVVSEDGTLKLNQNAKPTVQDIDGLDSAFLESFERTQSLGGFEYTGPKIDGSKDILPPASVIDLTAEQLDVFDVTKGFKLMFTAPGDDYDVGKASSYELRYTYGDARSLRLDFDKQKEVLPSNLIAGDLNSPASSGNEESFNVVLNDLPKDSGVLKIGFAMRAVDESGNAAEASNVALLDLFITPPEVCVGENGQIQVGNLLPVPEDCSKFYECDVLGNAVLFNCSANLVFNPSTDMCDYPENVPGCETFSVRSTNLCEGLHDDIVQDPVTCKVYRCKWGVEYEIVCPDGTIWNPDKYICDWAESVANPCQI